MLYDNIAVKLISKSLSSKDWWSTLKSFITTTNKTCIPSIEYNDIIFSSEHDKANILNNFFESQSLLNDQDAPLPAILPTMVKSELKSIALTTYEVEFVLKIVPVGKASGPNGLSNRILRELSHGLSIPYCSLLINRLILVLCLVRIKKRMSVLSLKKVIYQLFPIIEPYLSLLNQKIKCLKDLYLNTCIITFVTIIFSLPYSPASFQVTIP